MAKDVIYTNGVIAVKENKLLGDRLFKLCEYTADEAFRIVAESGFGKGAEVEGVQDFEKLLTFDEADIDAFIREYAPTNVEKEYLLSPRDYHNAKALIKAEYLKSSAEKMLAPDGIYTTDLLLACLKEGDYSPLDGDLQGAFKQAETLVSEAEEKGETVTGAQIGAIFDGALNDHLFRACRHNAFLKKQLTAKADMNNILTCLRADDFEFAKNGFFKGGKLSEEKLKLLFSENEEVKEHALDGTDYAQFYADCLAARRAGKPLTEGERTVESFETYSLKLKKYELTRAQPFLYYVFRRRAENANLRILFVCLAAGMDERDIKNRLRAF